MRFLRRNASSSADSGSGEAVEVDSTAESHANKAYTPKKGRPTPSRRAAEAKRRGPVAPPPKNTREAIRRSRELRKQNPVSKEERKAAMRERRERMMAGEDAYLMPRDRGPVKAYMRDLVDARRNLLGLFMPLAILVFGSLLVPNMAVQQWATLITTVVIATMALEAVFLGRRNTKLVRERFPDEIVKGRSVGWYTFVRASQLRRLRVPKPRVKPGDKV